MRLFKHENCQDIAAEFLKVIRCPNYMKVKLCWYNICNPDKVYPLGITETVTIQHADWLKWRTWPPLTAQQKWAYGVGEDTLAGNDRDL